MHEPHPIRTSESAAARWAPLARFIDIEARIGKRAEQGRASAFAYEFLRFGFKQAWACLFGAAMVALLVGTALWYPRGAALARYDFLFLAALAIQAAMLMLRLETIEEAKVILIFHVIATVMEIFKTATGSWIYPEAAFFRIEGVPLFSGFMYASIGSYMSRVWRLCDFRFTRHPPMWAVYLLALAIYLNFYSDHYFFDFRWFLFAAAALLFGRTWIHYRVWQVHRRMPLLLACFLTASFVWFAENIGTLSRAWLYPHQSATWSLVHLNKLGSWFLLLIISYALVAAVNRPEPMTDDRAPR